MSGKTKRLAESGMLLALAIVLEFVAKVALPFLHLPMGGQFTIASMLPVVLISYRYGVKWGFVTGIAYSLIEMLIGIKNVSAAFQPGYFGDGVMIFNAVIMCLMDYILAFIPMCLGGAFRNKIKNPGVSLMLGSVAALGCRYLAHTCSGFILFRSYAEWFFTQDNFPAWGAWLVDHLGTTALGIVYSLIYNGLYMIPEIVITAVFALLIAKIPGVVKKVDLV